MSDETASQPQIKFSWLIGTVVAFCIFAIIGNYSARMTRTYTDYDDQRAEQRKVTLAKVQDAESKLINPVNDKKNPTAEWIDQDKGLIRIPIDEAMGKEVEALGAKPAAMGSDINPAAPAPAAAPASAPAPAAPAAPAPAPDKPKKANT